jgi:zinc protease
MARVRSLWARGEGESAGLIRRLAGWALAVTLATPALAHAVPTIEHWTLANGARVYFVEAHDLPMVQLRAVFDAGAARDPQGREGVAMFASHLLREGTGDLDADAVAARFENLGAEFSAGAERDMATVDLRSLVEPSLLEPALDLYAALVREPSYPPASLERERARALVGLKRDEQNPGAVVEKAFYHALYGPHPYGRDPLGSEQTLKAIAREDLVSHHRRYFVGRNALLVIVGDVSKREAKRIAEKVLGALPAGEPAPALPAVPAPHNSTRQIAFPATQSHIRIGTPTMARLDPDFFPLHVGNYILGGGGLVSRLSTEVREKRGLSYSVYSYFYPMREKGPFVLGLQTKNASRGEALALVRRVLSDFVENGPSDEELVAAKKHLTGGFPLRLDSNRKIADQLSIIAFYGLPLDWLDQYPARIEAVTAAQIRDAFRRHLKLDALTTVTVGG